MRSDATVLVVNPRHYYLVILLLGVPVAAVIAQQHHTASQYASTAQQLADCLKPPEAIKPTTYADFVHGTPNRLQVYKLWHSSKLPAFPLTFFTGLTASRLNQLKAQCQHWPGPLSVAVYVPVQLYAPLSQLALPHAATAAAEDAQHAHQGSGMVQRIVAASAAAAAAAPREAPPLALTTDKAVHHGSNPHTRRKTAARALRAASKQLLNSHLGGAMQGYLEGDKPMQTSGAAVALDQRVISGQLAPTVAALKSLHDKMEAEASSCALDIMLLYEPIADANMTDIIPINTLRNHAALQAHTELISMIDVDLLPSKTLATFLSSRENLQMVQHACADQNVIVTPVFQTAVQWGNITAGHELADRAATLPDKSSLQQMVEQGLVYQFHVTHFRWGHDCTHYKRWFQSNKTYPVRKCWNGNYEPYFIINRRLNPWYDATFRGYGWNKVSHVTNVYHQGFGFQVLPEGFLVHRQHETSPISNIYYASNLDDMNSNGNVRVITARFKEKVLRDLETQQYRPVTDQGLQTCLQKLSWWTNASAH
eukprot:GHRR01002358.1.p1 GENE.GHRR01002358.1~~GHRR01002358.1.p1  ORF type:complete len:538 (+),score=168.78 GHRR01002358.1:431-2044(+)